MPKLQEHPPNRLTDDEADRLRALPDPHGFVWRLALGTGLVISLYLLVDDIRKRVALGFNGERTTHHRQRGFEAVRQVGKRIAVAFLLCMLAS